MIKHEAERGESGWRYKRNAPSRLITVIWQLQTEFLYSMPRHLISVMFMRATIWGLSILQSRRAFAYGRLLPPRRG